MKEKTALITEERVEVKPSPEGIKVSHRQVRLG